MCCFQGRKSAQQFWHDVGRQRHKPGARHESPQTIAYSIDPGIRRPPYSGADQPVSLHRSINVMERHVRAYDIAEKDSKYFGTQVGIRKVKAENWVVSKCVFQEIDGVVKSISRQR